MQNNGFLYVATLDKKYLKLANHSVRTLKEQYPQAHATLFTHFFWKDEASEHFDNVVIDDIPIHPRTKLLACGRTPYDITLYLDADTEIVHPDICEVFKELDKDKDMAIARTLCYTSNCKDVFEEGMLHDHCGVLLYHRNPKTLDFFKDWWRLDVRARSGDKDLPHKNFYDPEYRGFDMWSFFYLTHYTNWKHKLKRQELDIRWNYLRNWAKRTETNHEIVVEHFLSRTE